jgi:hypothetical protein
MEMMQVTLNRTSDSIHSLEQQILIMRQHQDEIRVPSLLEIDSIMQKNMYPLEQRFERGERAAQAPTQVIADPMNAVLVSNMEITKRVATVEQGVAELLTKASKEPKYDVQAGNLDSKFQTSSTQSDMAEFRKGLKRLEETLASDVCRKVIDKLPDVMTKAMANQEHQFQASAERPIGAITPQIVGRSLSPMPPLVHNPLPPPTMETKVQEVMPMPRGENQDFEAVAEATSVQGPVANQSSLDTQPTEMPAKVNAKDKFTMATDHAVDTSKIALKEDAGMASVFGTTTDPEVPVYNVEDFYKKHGLSQRIARSPYFANGTVLVVVLNAIYLGVDSDYNDEQNLYDAEIVFQVWSQFFAIYFTWEVLVRFVAFERKADCLKDGWFKFDLFLVTTMVLDIWVLMVLLKVLSGDGNQVKIPTQPLRMLRLFKLSRMARLMKSFPELVTMIKGLVRSLRAIASSMVLVGLMVYTWAILIHMLMKEDHEYNKDMKEKFDYEFTMVGDVIWTLLMAGTLMLDNAAPVMTDLLFNKDFVKVIVGLAFISYCWLSALLILQMLIGVLCDVVSQVGQERRDSECIGLVRQELLGDFQKYDDGDGKISREEFLLIVNSDNSKALLKKLNINRLFLLEVADLMFPSTTDVQVPIKTILEMMIMCRGSNTATVEIVSSALMFLSNELGALEDGISTKIENELNSFKGTHTVAVKHRKSFAEKMGVHASKAATSVSSMASSASMTTNMA